MFSSRTDWDLTPNRLAAELARMRARGREVLDLTESNPTSCGFRYERKAILRALARPAALQYHPDPRGMRSARQAVAGYYRWRATGAAGLRVAPDRILLTASTSEAYSFVLRLLCNPGDQVLVPSPSYPLFEFLAGLNDVELVPYALVYDHGWQIDLHSLQSGITSRSRAVVVVNPNNPTGSFVKAHEVRALSALCAEQGLALVADEVFLDYAHDDKARLSLAANRNVLTFTLSGLSKISALPQMKAAWIVVNGPSLQVRGALQRLEVIADTYLSVNTPAQVALPALLAQRRSMQAQIRRRVAANRRELAKQLASHPACRVLESEGGWYVLLRIPIRESDDRLALDLLRKRAVLVHPGHFYGLAGEGHLVLSLIVPEGRFRKGLRRLLGALAG
ncbi:MAG: pyridoxal phosphate-dependent aminotransferase [Acidobacteriota bacterium]|nr:pyridoxal phosphate-dependent aminotransferase [Acidobacteriota bacterium]